MRVPGAERSDGPCGLQRPSGRAEKCRAWGGHGQRSMPVRRALACCGCLSGVSAANKASSAAPPQARASQVARSEAEGQGQWGRFCVRITSLREVSEPRCANFAYFLLAKQKKVGAPPGADPGIQRPHPPPRHPPHEPVAPLHQPPHRHRAAHARPGAGGHRGVFRAAGGAPAGGGISGHLRQRQHGRCQPGRHGAHRRHAAGAHAGHHLRRQ